MVGQMSWCSTLTSPTVVAPRKPATATGSGVLPVGAGVQSSPQPVIHQGLVVGLIRHGAVRQDLLLSPVRVAPADPTVVGQHEPDRAILGGDGRDVDDGHRQRDRDDGGVERFGSVDDARRTPPPDNAPPSVSAAGDASLAGDQQFERLTALGCMIACPTAQVTVEPVPGEQANMLLTFGADQVHAQAAGSS